MVAQGNVGLAFGLVIGAGAATCVGACIAFFAALPKTRFLAAMLGLSAGIMTYVSFVELFVTAAVGAFEDYGTSYNAAYRYATLSFFGGVIFTWLLDHCVHFVVDKVQAKEEAKHEHKEGHGESGPAALAENKAADEEAGSVSEAGEGENKMSAEQMEKAAQILKSDCCYHSSELNKMGMLTMIAIFIHNFPEGMATFVGTLADATSGAAIAIAIALHNIPEGICVAMPIYYSTGSKWKAFFWAAMSGVSEPFGGLIGYLILYKADNLDLVYGILFGVVSGMMVYIACKELIPTALKYDPEDKVVSIFVFVGMMIMAGSLVLFTLT